MHYYSAANSGFYSDEFHGSVIPGDAVQLTTEEYSELLAGQSDGFRIVTNSDGRPVLVAMPIDHRAAIAARRYQAETAGITVNGMALPTDRDSLALVTGAALAAVIDPAYSCQWKTSTGFIDVNAQQIIAMASAMRAHIQVCFDREAELLTHLENGTYTDDMLDQGWPV